MFHALVLYLRSDVWSERRVEEFDPCDTIRRSRESLTACAARHYKKRLLSTIIFRTFMAIGDV